VIDRSLLGSELFHGRHRLGAKRAHPNRGLRFKNLHELNAWLLDKCVSQAKVHRHPELTEQTIWEVFETERPKLVHTIHRFRSA
jgi:hypothetical protein